MKKNMSAMNVAVIGHEIMEEVVLMATLLVSYARSMTIAIASTHAKVKRRNKNE
tara:strand:- start:1268 stop:1429 length:162 start_codon:yes stop_codon:yes gene_type:complete